MTFPMFFQTTQQVRSFIFFSILLFTIIGISGCTYKFEEQSFRISEGNTSVVLTLGDSHTTKLYNFKTPQEIIFNPPSGYHLIMEGQKVSSFSKTLQPQDAISLSFNILKDGDSMQNLKTIEQTIVSFKEESKPKNQTILKTSGKSSSRYGDNNFFTVLPEQKTVLIELHEYNIYPVHKFYYQYQHNDLQITLKPPTGHSFVFDKIQSKKYDFVLNPHDTVSFSMQIKPDWSDKPYERIYHFISY